MAQALDAQALPRLIQTTPATLPRRIKAAKRGTMRSPSDRDTIKITAEDLARGAIPEPPVSAPGAQSPGAKVYGTINETAAQFASLPPERGSIPLQGWFDLGFAGPLGAAAGLATTTL